MSLYGWFGDQLDQIIRTDQCVVHETWVHNPSLRPLRVFDRKQRKRHPLLEHRRRFRERIEAGALVFVAKRDDVRKSEYQIARTTRRSGCASAILPKLLATRAGVGNASLRIGAGPGSGGRRPGHQRITATRVALCGAGGLTSGHRAISARMCPAAGSPSRHLCHSPAV